MGQHTGRREDVSLFEKYAGAIAFSHTGNPEAFHDAQVTAVLDSIDVTALRK